MEECEVVLGIIMCVCQSFKEGVLVEASAVDVLDVEHDVLRALGDLAQLRTCGGRMTKRRQSAQTGDAEVAGGKRTPLLDHLMRSINGAMFSKSRKRSF
jgi:hypothetical protein